jgi:hypothetical protein
MKKFLIADLMKSLEEDRIAEIRAKYGVSIEEANQLIKEHGYGGLDDADEAAEAYGVSITEVTGEDVDNYFDMGGARGQLESTAGSFKWVYDITLASYLLLMNEDILYKIPPDMMKEWNSSDSSGTYYNENIRGNTSIEDADMSCGCTPEPCSPAQLAYFNNKYSA